MHNKLLFLPARSALSVRVFRPTFAGIGLAILYGISVFLLYHRLCACDIFTEPMLFRTESALFYRYTAMVAEQGFIPWYDDAIQYPEGMAVYRETPLLMEYAIGYLYRIWVLFLPSIGLQAFITLFKIFFTSLSIFPVYLIARLISQTAGGALIATLFYLLAPGFYSRIATPQAYLLEHFSLPFLFVSVAIFLIALRKESRIQALVAGFVMSVALASWQLPQFFLLLLLGYFCLKFVCVPEIPERETVIGLLYVSPSLIVGTVLPFVKNMPVSPLTLLSLSLGIALWLARRLSLNRPARTALFGALFGSAWLLTDVLRSGEYSHVYSLIYYKLRFLGQKPADPALLPYDVRVYWTAGYRTPGFADIVRSLGAIIIAAVIPFGWSIRHFRRLEPYRQLLLYLGVCFIILYALMSRMAPLLTFFLAPTIAGLNFSRKSHLVALLVLLGVQGGLYVQGQVADYQPYPAKFEQLILENTAPEDVILAEFYQAPTILAYYNRPINLHSIFESAAYREKVKAYYFALVGSEEQFHQYARQVDADYFLFEPRLYVHTDTSSLRYYTDTIDNLSPDSALQTFVDLTPETPYFRLVAFSPYGALYQVK